MNQFNSTVSILPNHGPCYFLSAQSNCLSELLLFGKDYQAQVSAMLFLGHDHLIFRFVSQENEKMIREGGVEIFNFIFCLGENTHQGGIIFILFF